MSSNKTYRGPQDLPGVLPVFPLAGALLLPRGQMPLNIFEPRYITMVDDALRADRIIGMIQPDLDVVGRKKNPPLFGVGCAGRITQLAETGDGRYVMTLTGISRFKLVEEVEAMTPYRQARADFAAFASDFEDSNDEIEVDRAGILRALREFAEVNSLEIDWKSIDQAPNEALVNALSMMSPFGPREKQALLEAVNLKTRADVLIAITEIELARGKNNSTSLQ